MLEYDVVEYYEYDFDNDGINEIGIPYNSGAGGAFMYDGFGIFKKDKDGLHYHYADGLDCSMRDGQRLINFNGKIYFINNLFSNSMDAPFDMNAKCIDAKRNAHIAHIELKCENTISFGFDENVALFYDTEEGFVKNIWLSLNIYSENNKIVAINLISALSTLDDFIIADWD